MPVGKKKMTAQERVAARKAAANQPPTMRIVMVGFGDVGRNVAELLITTDTASGMHSHGTAATRTCVCVLEGDGPPAGPFLGAGESIPRLVILLLW